MSNPMTEVLLMKSNLATSAEHKAQGPNSLNVIYLIIIILITAWCFLLLKNIDWSLFIPLLPI